MRPSDHAGIRELDLFRSMTQDAFERLMRGVYVQQFPEGLTIIEQGQPADFMHILLEGQVELFSSWAGRETTMAVLTPISTFILAATIKDAPYLMSARTLMRSRIMLVPSAGLREIFREDAAFAEAIITELAGCYRSVVRQTKGMKLRNSRERIAAWVMHQSRDLGGVRSFSMPVEKRLLASYLGMTAENLSRGFKALEPDGLKVDGARVILTDPERLLQVARLDPLMDGPDSPEGLPLAISPGPAPADPR